MRAFVLGPGGPFLDLARPRPSPGPAEALIRVSLAGICSTDLELVKGYAGFEGVLGHEFVGVVEAAPEPGWVGRRVVGGINIGCGDCAGCRAGEPEHCPRRTVAGIRGRDGTFADFLTLPLTNLWVVPEAVPDEAAVFTEPLAAALRITRQVEISADSRAAALGAAVLGPGRLGLLAAQVLALRTPHLQVLGRSAASLELPARLGLSTGLAADAPDNSFDLVVETTGNEAGLAQALRLVRPRGTLVAKSTFHGKTTVDLTKLVVAEITVVGSRCGPFAPALELLEHGKIRVAPLTEATYPLENAIEALRHAARPGVRKVLLRP